MHFATIRGRDTMKNSDGQLYTIEGFAAALIMLITAFLVVNATSVYTAGDTHISDMQLEALGTDALNVMDTNESLLSMSPLMYIIINGTPADNATFGAIFRNLINNRTASGPDHIQYTANYSYWNIADKSVNSAFINASRNLSGGEHAVRATKWVLVNKTLPGDSVVPEQNRTVLVEVLMWRD
jgi:hypothetical protein